MRAVYQTRRDELGQGPGNCLQAAVASFLNLPIDRVPDFFLTSDPDWSMRVFFAARGFDLVEKPADFVPADGYYFETGTSTQGNEHIVISRAGARIHDPNPVGGGLVSRDRVLWPRPVNDLALRIATDARPSDPDDSIELREIHPNEGVRAWYRELLQDLSRRMTADILRRLRKHYRPAAARLAQDDDPIVTLRKVMRIWGRLWQKRFDDLSADIAASFAGRTQRYTDAAIRRRMRDAGFTVRFRPTERQVSAYRAVIAENVNLIKSIPRDFLRDVESAVWTAVQRGGAMGELSTTIRNKYGVTYRRAALIARDQVNKSKAVLENARRAELGITEATWVHSHAGKQPRPTHVKMHGRRFVIADGMYDSAEGRKVQPGELINCRCTSRAIIPGRLSKR